MASPAGSALGITTETLCLFWLTQSGKLAIFTYLWEDKGRSTSYEMNSAQSPT
jgi:hypothetical protein